MRHKKQFVSVFIVESTTNYFIRPLRPAGWQEKSVHGRLYFLTIYIVILFVLQVTWDNKNSELYDMLAQLLYVKLFTISKYYWNLKSENQNAQSTSSAAFIYIGDYYGNMLRMYILDKHIKLDFYFASSYCFHRACKLHIIKFTQVVWKRIK